MTKSKFLILLLAIALTSCNSDKKYTYVEVVLEKGIAGMVDRKEKEPKIINAKNDTLAYLYAFQNFCISVKVHKDMQETYGDAYASTPLEFKLLNEVGENIASSTFFITKAEKEKEIEDRVFSLENSINHSAENRKNEEFKETVKVDSAKVKELEKFFRLKKDEFSNNNEVWYKPKSAPQYTNRNGIYCYFQTENGMPSNLRFRVQYHNDDWLFFSRIQFSIDEKAYEYIPRKTETDCGNGGYIWEWFDEQVSQLDKELLYALANAKNAKMKFIGRQYYDIKTISQQQILDIKRTLELYNALGGNY
ncbi:MAG: hypothetical protein LBL74_08335 [Bacteroidales bacterium]|jgi:hypothetical protein|nr:hypothetical protein [Bacteroidales bacterium]